MFVGEWEVWNCRVGVVGIFKVLMGCIFKIWVFIFDSEGYVDLRGCWEGID